MKRNCPHCLAKHNKVSNHGHFVRSSDKRKTRRYRCSICLKSFSDATFNKLYRQRKRHLHPRIVEHLSGCTSQRRIAKLLKISRTTVHRKLQILGQIARGKFKSYWESQNEKVQYMQFDDLETFEHTKCKPLSVTMAVEDKTRQIMGFQVSRFAAKGKLAKLARKKYGFRKDERATGRNLLFKELKQIVNPNVEILSDQSPHYPLSVRLWFPGCRHKITKGQRGCVVGQGELKAGGFDPLFSLNHTYAMLRDNIKRLSRRTWCTTKL